MTKQLVIAILCGVMLLPAQGLNSPESLLQAATKKEVVDGDLKSAIEGYKKALAAAKNNRAVAAKALFQLGEAYRKQGNTEARAAFERLLREYADQPQAAQAKAHLASLGETPKANAGIRMEKLFDAGNNVCSSISRDGKWMGCAIGWINEIAVRNIATGEMKVLTALRKETPANRFINTFAISPDGKWIAYQVYRDGGVESELAVVPTDGSASSRVVFKDPQIGWFDVHGWTPDSKEVLTTMNRKVTLVALADGKARTIREISFGLQWVPVAYSPDGKWLAVSVPGAGGPRVFDIEVWSADGREANSILKTDAYEQVLGWAPDGKSLFVESAAGGRASIVRLAMENGKRVGEPVTVRDGIDHLSPLGIDARGALYYVNRRADTNIKTMEFDSQRGTVSGTEKMLSNRHVNRQGFPSWSSDGRKIAWWTFLATPDTSTIMQPQLLVRNIDGGYDASVMPEKPFFPQQTPSWDAQNRSLLMLVNQGDVRTYRLSRLDPETGKLTPVSAPIEIPNVGASPIWTPDARYLFQRMGPNGNLVRRDIQTGEEQVVYDNANRNGALRQIALSPDGKRIAFSVSPRDRRATQSIAENLILFVADLETGALKQVDTHNFAWGAGTLTWTPDGRWLVYPSDFNDKITPLWIVPSDLSAAPRALGGEPGEVRQIGFSPDGRTIHFSRTTRAEEYWVMDRFQ